MKPVTTNRPVYARIDAAPAYLVWVTPRANQGQIVEVSYATGVRGPGANYDACEGDPWRRIIDHSDGTTEYAHLV